MINTLYTTTLYSVIIDQKRSFRFVTARIVISKTNLYQAVCIFWIYVDREAKILGNFSLYKEFCELECSDSNQKLFSVSFAIIIVKNTDFSRL